MISDETPSVAVRLSQMQWPQIKTNKYIYLKTRNIITQ